MQAHIVEDEGWWMWEIVDEFGVYLRSTQFYASEHEARKDFEDSTHLIRANLANA